MKKFINILTVLCFIGLIYTSYEAYNTIKDSNEKTLQANEFPDLYVTSYLVEKSSVSIHNKLLEDEIVVRVAEIKGNEYSYELKQFNLGKHEYWFGEKNGMYIFYILDGVDRTKLGKETIAKMENTSQKTINLFKGKNLSL